MRPLPLALASVMLVGCRGSATDSPEERARREAASEPPPPLPTEGFAVLPFGSQVYAAPNPAAPSWRLGWPMMEPPPWPARGFVVRVMGQRDGFVEIAPVLDHVQPCEEVLHGDAFDVRLFVSAWTPAPVLTRDLRFDFEDGTSVALKPGVPVLPIEGDAEGRYAVAPHGMRMRLEIPADAVGQAYQRAEPFAPQHQGWELLPNTHFSFDGGRPVERPDPVGYLPVVITSVDGIDGRTEVGLGAACLSARMHSDQGLRRFDADFHTFDFGLGAPQLEPLPEEVPVDPGLVLDSQLLEEVEFVELQPAFDGDGLIGTLGAPPPGPPAWIFEEGAPLYLGAAGPRAGTLSMLRRFGEESWGAGDRMCFSTSFGMHFDPIMAICLDAGEGRQDLPETSVDDFGLGTVKPGSITIKGALSEEEVARTLRRNRIDLRRCYNAALQRDLQLAGTLELAVRVDGEGGVTDVKLRSPWMPFVDCAIENAKIWSWPAPTDGQPARVVFSVELTTQR